MSAVSTFPALLWSNETTPRGGGLRRDFTLQRTGAQDVPGSLWCSPNEGRPTALVLVSHGGSGHKHSRVVTDLVDALVPLGGWAVCAIDGPVHGGRRAVFSEGPTVRDEFRALWEQGGRIDGMVEDWRLVLDALCATGEFDETAIGWCGLSMGTAYGIPLLAKEPRIRAAVIGMWGLSRAGSERLAGEAPAIQARTLFQMKWDDPLFTRSGQFDLFDCMGGAEKQLNAYPGGHVDPAGAQLEDAITFLTRSLRPDGRPG